MKDIHNIFSKKKKKSQHAPPLIIDTREASSKLVAALEERGVLTVFEKLDIGDYIAGNTIVERKTVSDFVNSTLQKRLGMQLSNLKAHQSYILLIEGFDFNYHHKGIGEHALRGMFLSAILDFGVPVFFTKNEQDSVEFLLSLLRRKRFQKEASLRPTKKAKNSQEEKQFILEGFPGIGPVTAKKLLKKYKTLQSIFNLNTQEPQGIEKFDDEKIKKFRHLLTF